VFISLSITSSEVDETFGLFIRPKSCVIEEKKQHCEVTIEVQWKLDGNRDVCLYIDNQVRELACWQQRSSIIENFSIDVETNVKFYLKDKVTNEIIYSAPFSLYLKLAKYRKKRRNPWSFY